MSKPADKEIKLGTLVLNVKERFAANMDLQKLEVLIVSKMHKL